MKGMATCKACGRNFALMVEEHYVVCDPKKNGVFPSLVDIDKAYEYDAFDCPFCGCQFIAQERKPRAKEETTSENEPESFQHHILDDCGCESCKYVGKDECEEPCKSCIHCDKNAGSCKYEMGDKDE